MAVDTAARVKQYIVHIEQFEGPLDLLLHLVKVNEIDIYDIPISKITDQYLEYINLMEHLNINLEADFLIIASTLIYLKSCELLPPPPGEEQFEAEDLKEEFTRRLIEYQVFKEASASLGKKDKDQIGIYTRPDSVYKELVKSEASEEMLDVSLFDMLSALKEVLDRLSKTRTFKLTSKRYYIEDKIEIILNRLKNEETVSLLELFATSKDKAEAITFFLAVLELTKEKIIRCSQDSTFKDIVIRKQENIENLEDLTINSDYNE